MYGTGRTTFIFKIQTRHIKLNEAFWTNFRYADVMCSVLNNQFGYLIASIEREVDSPGCMPHSLSFDDVKDLFGKLLNFSRGSSINDVSSEGVGGGRGGHKIGKMSQRRLSMSPRVSLMLAYQIWWTTFLEHIVCAFHPDFEIVN